MKTRNLLPKIIWLSFTSILLCLTGCDEIFNTDKNGIEETIFTNPNDAQIIQLDSAGRKAIFLGEKDQDGLPTKITQAIVDGEDLTVESRTLITFDDENRAISMSSEAYGYMTFDYISDDKVVVEYTLPDHSQSFQTTYNTENGSKVGGCGCSDAVKEQENVYQMRKEVAEPIINPPKATPNIHFTKMKTSDEIKGNIYTFFNQTANPVTGNTLFGMWETSDGKTGALKITDDGPGKFNYFFPYNPAPPPPSGFSDKAKKLLTLLCLGAIPVTLAKEHICVTFTAGFAACEAILTSYVWLCRANTTHTVGNFAYDIFTADKVYVTVTSMHPNLPVKRAETTFNPSSGYLPEINITYDAFAVIGELYTSPSDPDPLQGYTIYVNILNGIPNVDMVKLSMEGTDGYTKTQTYTVGTSSIFSMHIPGASGGVVDEITAEVVNQYPQPGQTKRIKIIF